MLSTCETLQPIMFRDLDEEEYGRYTIKEQAKDCQLLKTFARKLQGKIRNFDFDRENENKFDQTILAGCEIKKDQGQLYIYHIPELFSMLAEIFDELTREFTESIDRLIQGIEEQNPFLSKLQVLYRLVDKCMTNNQQQRTLSKLSEALQKTAEAYRHYAQIIESVQSIEEKAEAHQAIAEFLGSNVDQF